MLFTTKMILSKILICLSFIVNLLISLLIFLIGIYFTLIFLIALPKLYLQTVIFFLITLVCSVLPIIIFFKKGKIIKKIGITFLCLFSFIGAFKIPIVEKGIAIDTCIDTGICQEGIDTVIGDKELETVTKENCLKHNKVWQDGYCLVRETIQP